MKVLIFTLFFMITVKCNKGALDSSYNLPETIRPISYYLTIEPNFSTNNTPSNFNGSVKIDLNILETTKNITLHSYFLYINKLSIKVVDSEKSEINVANVRIDAQRQFYIIDLESELKNNSSYSLSIDEFSGNLRSTNNGFYVGNYQDLKNVSKYFTVSDFEPSDARKAFPCFDSPNMKAKFNIKVIRPCNYISLSNEELLFTNHLGSDRCEDTFKETVVMPTYVVAFMVSDFKVTPKVERHRIVAKLDAIENGLLDYALSEGVHILRVLENFTGIPYALSKMDQVAIPDEFFEEEAMENWGLVTFSEKHLFISTRTSKTEDIVRCTTYISHEFSHQWFGNLVTAKDWQYIWLSEGFAAYFQHYISSLIKPSWNLMEHYVVEVLHRVIEYDTHGTEPMNYPPKRLGSIPNPWICYYKASAVIRMTHNFLSTPVFKLGLHKYLINNKFKSVSPIELYEAYQEAILEFNKTQLLGNNDLKTILKSWDSNFGFPLITVSRDYTSGDVTINQTRYFETKTIENKSIWYVPINYVFEKNLHDDSFTDTTADLWLSNSSTTIRDQTFVDGWLILNKQQTGYYRVNYDIENWNRIADYLNTENFYKIHPVNRAQLINEAFHFAKYNYIPYGIALNISRYLIRETSYAPLMAFTESLNYVNELLQTSDLNDMFQAYVIKLLSTAYKRLGFEESSSDAVVDKLNRVNVIKWLCIFGHPECRQKSHEKLVQFKQTGVCDISPNLKAIILCCGLKSATLEEWQYIYNLSNSTKSNEYSSILGCIDDPNVVNRIFDIYVVSNKTMTDEERIILYGIMGTRAGVSTAADYIKNFSNSLSNLQKEFIYMVTSHLINKNQLTKMNIRSRVDENFYLRLDKIAENNIESINVVQRSQLEEWFSHHNDIDYTDV